MTHADALAFWEAAGIHEKGLAAEPAKRCKVVGLLRSLGGAGPMKRAGQALQAPSCPGTWNEPRSAGFSPQVL